MKNVFFKKLMTLSERPWSVPFFLVLLTAAFYPELTFLKSAPLVSDHWEQHYPWAAYFWKTLRSGSLPFWTDGIQCGFPLAAESQAGVFYLPNLILYGLLPLKAAYSLTVLLHFAAASVGTYFYGRVMGLSRLSSCLSAVIYTFGTAYGGAYYNITSLKTLAWLPLLLWAFETYYQNGRKSALAVIALISSSMLLAGYLQIALLSLVFFSAYGLFRIFVYSSPESFFDRGFSRALIALILSGCAAILAASPQILATFQLAIQSNRGAPEPGYAYSGSLSPFALITLVWPHAQALFRGNCLYNGILTLFFIIAAFSFQESRKASLVRLWTLLGALAFLMALGRFSPLYVLLVESTHFESFRTPAKFLVFINLAAAILAGAGCDAMLKERHAEAAARCLRSAAKSFLIFSGAALGLTAAGAFLMRGFREEILRLGDWAARQFIHGQPGHPHSLDVYQDKVRGFLDAAQRLLSFSDPTVPAVLVFFAISIGFAVLMMRYPSKRKMLITAAVCVITLDLYLFSWRDMRTDFLKYEQTPDDGDLAAAIRETSAQGEPGRIFGYRAWDENLPMLRSVNLLYGIEDIGAYSPLVLSRYYETIGRFGNVDDSTLAKSADPEFILSRLPLLNFLRVSHIIAARPLLHEDLMEVKTYRSRMAHLYVNRGYIPVDGYFMTGKTGQTWEEIRDQIIAPGFDPKSGLLLESREAARIQDLPVMTRKVIAGKILRSSHTGQSAELDIEVSEPCFFVRPHTAYPGWIARIDGREVPIVKGFGLFQSIFIDRAGRRKIEFRYSFIRALQELFYDR